MSISVRSGAGAVSYYLHLKEETSKTKEDYYTKEGEGVWGGSGAAKLGLEGQVSVTDFKTLAHGFSPEGEALVQNAGKEDRRAGWDLTFSAPKSVSVIWSVAHGNDSKSVQKNLKDVNYGDEHKRVSYVEQLTRPHETRQSNSLYDLSKIGMDALSERRAMLLHGDAFNQLQKERSEVNDSGMRWPIDDTDQERLIIVSEAEPNVRKIIEDAHNKAVDAALQFIQDHAAFSRRGHGGEIQEKADLIIAKFQHGTSRELDAQIHSHSFVMNVAVRPDGSFGTLEAKHFFEWQKVAGTVYQAVMSSELEKSGLRTSRDGDFIKMDAVPEALCKEASTRRNQIEEALAKSGREGSKASGIASLETRKAKNHDVTAEQLRPIWEAQAREHGFTAEHCKAGAAIEREFILPGELAERGLNDVTELNGILKDRDLYLAAAQQAMANGQGLEDIKTIYTSMREQTIELVRTDIYENKKGVFVTTEKIRYTTPELLKKEREILNSAINRSGETKHHLSALDVNKAINNFEEKKGWKLSPDQRKAIEYTTQNSGGLALVVGDAGTGKSTMAEVVKDAYEAADFKVLGCAPTNKAATGLQEGTGIQSTSVHKMIFDIDSGRLKLDDKTIIVMDEAAMTGSKTMHALNEKINEAGAKLVLMGDHKQLQSVEAGGVFRNIANEIETTRLDTNLRQNTLEHKEAVANLSKGEAAAALKYYVDNGLVHIEKTHTKAINECVNLYLNDRREVGAAQVVLLASTNKVVDDLNKAVRSELKKDGELGEERSYKQADGKAGKGKDVDLAVGDRVVFGMKSEDQFVKGEIGVVSGHREDGKVLIVNERTGKEFAVDIKETAIKHAYAMTINKSQGASVERAVVYASERTSKEMSYVEGSRAKEETKWVFTEAKIEKMAETAEPTLKMVQYAEALETARLQLGKPPELPDNYKTDFKECKAYLNEFDPRTISPVLKTLDPRLESLKDVLEAMSTSQQKETSLDYQVRENLQTPDLNMNIEATIERIEREMGDAQLQAYRVELANSGSESMAHDASIEAAKPFETLLQQASEGIEIYFDSVDERAISDERVNTQESDLSDYNNRLEREINEDQLEDNHKDYLLDEDRDNDNQRIAGGLEINDLSEIEVVKNHIDKSELKEKFEAEKGAKSEKGKVLSESVKGSTLEERESARAEKAAALKEFGKEDKENDKDQHFSK